MLEHEDVINLLSDMEEMLGAMAKAERLGSVVYTILERQAAATKRSAEHEWRKRQKAAIAGYGDAA